MRLARTILKNTLSNWTGMFFNVVIIILLTPYLLRHLGDERFGIYQIVLPIIQYLILLELGLRGSVTRFAGKYIAARDNNSLNSVVSTTFYICLVIGLIMVSVSFLLGLFAPHFFNVSEVYKSQALWIFAGLGFSTAISFLGYGFGGVLIGHNRYDLLNLQLIINNIIKAILIVCFFTAGWVSLSSWALAMVLSAVVGLIYIVIAAFWIQDKLSISLRHLKLVNLKELLSFSMWNMLVQLAGFLVLYANPLIIGRYMGPEAVSYYAIPFMLVTQLQGVVMGFSSTLLPLASSTLSSQNKDLIRHLLLKGTKTASMLVFPLGGVLLVMCKSLFGVWLPARYEDSWIIYAILMIAFFGSISQSTSSFILLGGGDIRGMALVYLTAGIVAIALGIVFIGYFGWGIIAAAVALVIPRFISTCMFQPWYASRQAGLNLWRYIKQSYTRPILCALPSVALGLLLVHYWAPRNLIFWVIEYFVALIPYGIFAITGVLDWPMREKIVAPLYGLFAQQPRV